MQNRDGERERCRTEMERERCRTDLGELKERVIQKGYTGVLVELSIGLLTTHPHTHTLSIHPLVFSTRLFSLCGLEEKEDMRCLRCRVKLQGDFSSSQT